jgi:ferredoxin
MNSCNVTFLPFERVQAVAPGESLIRAALQAGVHINASCGGEGVCGKCRILLEKGEVDGGLSERLKPEESDKGYRLACLSKVTGDVVVRIPVESSMDKSVMNLQVTPRRTATIQHPDFESLKERGLFLPPVEKIFLSLPYPDATNNMPDVTRLIEMLKHEANEHRLEMTLPVIRKLHSTGQG